MIFKSNKSLQNSNYKKQTLSKIKTVCRFIQIQISTVIVFLSGSMLLMKQICLSLYVDSYVSTNAGGMMPIFVLPLQTRYIVLAAPMFPLNSLLFGSLRVISNLSPLLAKRKETGEVEAKLRIIEQSNKESIIVHV
jgi:hypothetical protein